jgi:hypothetical protein
MKTGAAVTVTVSGSVTAVAKGLHSLMQRLSDKDRHTAVIHEMVSSVLDQRDRNIADLYESTSHDFALDRGAIVELKAEVNRLRAEVDSVTADKGRITLLLEDRDR